MKLLSLPQVTLLNMDSFLIVEDEDNEFEIRYALKIGNDISFAPINVQFDDYKEMMDFIHDRNSDRDNPYKIISERITIDGYDFLGLDIDTINVNKLTAVLTYKFTRKRKSK